MLTLKHKLPLIAGSDFILSRFYYFGLEEITKIIEILKQGIKGKTDYSGHIMFNNGKEIPFHSRLFTANIAATDLFNYLVEKNIDNAMFIAELKIYRELYPTLFGNEKKYAYCFR